jgi:DNA-binding HxlR family transcriptional regulator
MFNKFIEIEFNDHFPWGAKFTCAKPTKDRKYIQSLSRCRTYASLREIYPGVKNPLTHEMHRLWELGYVKKYTQKKFCKEYTWTDSKGKKHVTRIPLRSWYKITSKGKRLLRSVGL